MHFLALLISALAGLSLARHARVTVTGKEFIARDSIASASAATTTTSLPLSTAGSALSVASGATSMLLSLITTTATTTTMTSTLPTTCSGITTTSATPTDPFQYAQCPCAESIMSSSGTAMPKATHTVEVGADGQARFKPNSVDAAVGDILFFSFRALNHSLTQSTLDQPCVPSSGFDSGFNQYNAADSHEITVAFTVNTAEPQWFFCGQTDDFSHCDQGMVFAVNPGIQMNQFLFNAAASASTAATTTNTKSIISPVSTPASPAVTLSPDGSATSTLRPSLVTATISTAASTLLAITSSSPAAPATATSPMITPSSASGVLAVTSSSPAPTTTASTSSSTKTSAFTTATAPLTLSTSTTSLATTTLSNGGPFRRIRRSE